MNRHARVAVWSAGVGVLALCIGATLFTEVIREQYWVWKLQSDDLAEVCEAERRLASFNSDRALRLVERLEARWGPVNDGLRCRWVLPPGPFEVGTRPYVTVEVENTLDESLEWGVLTEISWHIRQVGESYSVAPKFEVAEVVHSEVVAHRGRSFTTYRCGMDSGGRVRLLCRLPWTLRSPGRLAFRAHVDRKPGNWGVAFGRLISCPPVSIDFQDIDSTNAAPKADA